MYNPNTIRRCVRRQFETNDGMVAFRTRSFTKRRGIYHPVVDRATGEVWCDCAHFRYRCAKYEPSIASTEFQCKHVKRAIALLKRLHKLDNNPAQGTLDLAA